MHSETLLRLYVADSGFGISLGGLYMAAKNAICDVWTLELQR